MIDINGWEFVIIMVIAFVLIGPDKLPSYVARLRAWVRDLRQMADGARTQLRQQMGPEFDNVDWKAYDPRQYDPRRIVREVLLEDKSPTSSPDSSAGSAMTGDSKAHRQGNVAHDPTRPTPYDVDAT
ncbi:Sec-independent protein translocase protein TatB [Austwickia sp. TVS 96-490-7B]|uniref:twin-arginine translocase TatA/TatE family subunit n=1 Tax=Austwickia sp. TVS 96-490-7B TaxID=2830843 RepID=UPI001E0C11C2|nr:twin-arginine translocase TatA/TatE family subunit [Austwickia sp. TVS 96-490-7B]MBW3086660.1 Sec-independent protein translocase protein TatB [Austwickia sp. TVS 96-490-7B]